MKYGMRASVMLLVALSACSTTQPVTPNNTSSTPRAQVSPAIAPPVVPPTPPAPERASNASSSLISTPTGTSVAGQPLHYFWPANLPVALQPRPITSLADATGFIFTTNVAGPYQVTLVGGTDVATTGQVTPQDIETGQSDLPKQYTVQNMFDCLRGQSVAALCPDTLRTVEVRGVQGQGVKVNEGGAYNIFWEEGGNVYVLLTSLPLEQALDIANNLEALDLVTWQARMQAFVTPTPTPSRPLVYFWPTNLPVTTPPLQVVPATATADTNGFTLKLESGGQPNAMILGGTAADVLAHRENGESVTIRGQPGMAFTTGAGYSVFWKEHGQGYALSTSFRLDEVQALAETLEPLDLATWQQYLASPPPD